MIIEVSTCLGVTSENWVTPISVKIDSLTNWPVKGTQKRADYVTEVYEVAPCFTSLP